MDSALEGILRAGVVYPVNTSGSGDQTIRAAQTSKRWVVFQLGLRASGATNVIVKSGSTEITGAIPFTTQLVTIGDGKSVLWAGRQVNQAFVLNSSAVMDLDGWVLLAEVDA